MAKVKFKRFLSDGDLDNVPVEDGSFIVTKSGTSYVDYADGRVAFGGTADTEMSDESVNSVQNKVVKEYVDDIKASTITEIDSSLEWKYLGTTTGSNGITIPSNWKEIMVFTLYPGTSNNFLQQTLYKHVADRQLILGNTTYAPRIGFYLTSTVNAGYTPVLNINTNNAYVGEFYVNGANVLSGKTHYWYYR